MNIDELQSVRDRERQTDRPQQLRESFYADVGAFVEQLRAERERAAERHGSPYADEVMQLTDEIEAASQLVEDIHERRIGKVVKAASLEAAELSPEVDGLTTEERDLFETLVADIERHRADVLATVEGEESTGTASSEPGRATAKRDTATVDAADVMGSEAASDDPVTGPGRDDAGREERDTRSEHPDPAEMRPDTAPGETSEGAGAPDPGTATEDDAPTRHSMSDRPDGTTEDDGREEPVGAERRTTDESRRESETDHESRREGETGGNERAPAAGRSGDGTRSGETSQSSRAESQESVPTIGNSIERERVLVTEDVATFVGSDDRDYDLAVDDIVTLPSTNADLLVERDAARRL